MSVTVVGWRTQLGSVCVCVFGEAAAAAAEQGVAGTAIRANAVPPVKQVDVWTACLGRPPPRQSHFPKVAVTHGALSSMVYVTVLVKGIMAWHLTFLLGGEAVTGAGAFYGCETSLLF